jgi:hypothetical protein
MIFCWRSNAIATGQLRLTMSLQPIQSARSLRQINIPGVNTLMVKWAPHHAMALNSRILGTPYHPLHEQTKRRWDSRTDPLWWNCLISTKVGGNKKVVRGWLNSRAKVAFTNSLKSKGYAKNGARLAKDSEEDVKGDLVGSAQFLVLPQLLHTSWKDLCKQTDLIVAAIEEKQRQDGAQNRRERRLDTFGKSSQPQTVQSRLILT